MTADLAASVAVTLLFALPGLYFLLRVVVGRSWIDRVSNAVHVVMSIVMIAMPWPWAAAFPAIAQIVFFTATTFWYASLALFRPQAESLVGPANEHHRRPVLLWYHAAMSVAMAWMAVAMSPMASATPMDGMDMAHAGHLSAAAAEMVGHQPWAEVVTRIWGILFVIAAVLLLAWTAQRTVRATRLAGAELVGILDLLASAAMAAGMACGFLLLMT